MNLLNLFFGFRGRIGRGIWGLCQAACIVIAVVTPVLFEKVLGAESSAAQTVALALSFWINLTSTVKRFHDRDKSAVWFLISFVPGIGQIWILVECGSLAGTPGTNSYGDPASAVLSESTSSGFDSSEATIQSLLLELQTSKQSVNSAAGSPRASSMGYAMREEAPVAKRPGVSGPATTFGRRNGFR